MFTRRCVLSASVLAFGLDRAAFAQEQSYPDRVIKLVVPFPAGGPTDIMGRIAGQLISSALGQNVAVENRPGAGGTIGSQDVARANADGYTLLLGGTNTNAINAAIYKNLNFDPVKDFTPIASIAVDTGKNARGVYRLSESEPGQVDLRGGSRHCAARHGRILQGRYRHQHGLRSL